MNPLLTKTRKLYLFSETNFGLSLCGLIMLLLMSGSVEAQICPSSANTIEPITYVGFGDIDNATSPTSSNGYEDFTAQSTQVAAGESFVITLKGNTGGNYNNRLTVFIDWNQNEILDDPGEKYDIGGIINSTGTDGKFVIGVIEVPLDVTPGNTRMRIIKNIFFNEVNPCGSYAFGQTEDYTVEVIALEACAGIPSAGTPVENAITVCPDETFTVSVTDIPEQASGLTSVWQSSPAGANNWEDIFAALSSSYTASEGIQEATDYRHIFRCVYSGETNASVVIQVSMNPDESACYCIPEATNPEQYINSFSTTSGQQNINNENSGFSPGGYGEFQTLTLKHGLGGTINFEASIVGEIAGFKIWVDWNQDGVFDLDNEVAYHSTIRKSLHTGSFMVPGNALTGPTRMRIASCSYCLTGNDDPCATGFISGEFEDYTFIVSDIAAWDCPDLEANIGDPCDDGDPTTINNFANANCECEGETTMVGEFCGNPINISGLPYTTTDNTANYGYFYDPQELPSNMDINIVFMEGKDVTYAYTPSQNEVIDVLVTDHGSWAGIFIFTGCPFTQTVAFEGDPSAAVDLSIPQLAVEAGVTYYFVISTGFQISSTPYTLSIVAGTVDATDTNSFTFAMYPNPVDRTESLTLSSKSAIDRYEVFDITGKVIDAKTVSNQNEIQIGLDKYSSGLYILKVYSRSDFSVQKMIIR